jgi:hypothetical protein
MSGHDLADQLLAELKRNGNDTGQLAQRLVAEAPDAIARFAARCIEEQPGQSNVVNNYVASLLSFMPHDGWPELVPLAVAALQTNRDNGPANEVIRSAGLQRPAAVHPYLEPLFASALHYAEAFWGDPTYHEAQWEDVAFLVRDFAVMEPEARRRAARALLETRLPEAFAFVAEHAAEHLSYLPQVGFVEAPAGFRQLYPERPLHLTFPQSYLASLFSDSPLPFRDGSHPTWVRVTPSDQLHRFGGASEMTCGVCGHPAHNLLTLDPVPEGYGVTGLPRLEIATCLSCLGWERERLTYTHDAEGRPHDLTMAEPHVIPQFPMVPLMETWVGLADLGPRWRWQEWDEEQNLHRLGGHLFWVQGGKYIECARCGQISTFLLQLESPLVPGEGADYREFLWGMGGICYAFWCDGCKVSTLFWETT